MAGNKIASSPLTAGGALYSLINTSYDLFCVQHGLTLGDMVNAAILTGAFCSGYGLVIGIGWTLGDMAYGYYSGQSTTDVLNRYALLRW